MLRTASGIVNPASAPRHRRASNRTPGPSNQGCTWNLDSLRAIVKRGTVLKFCCLRACGCETIGALFLSEINPVNLEKGVFSHAMNSVVITTVLSPGFVSVLLSLVFPNLPERSPQPYFRAWQFAWAAYSLHYVLDTF